MTFLYYIVIRLVISLDVVIYEIQWVESRLFHLVFLTFVYDAIPLSDLFAGFVGCVNTMEKKAQIN